MVSREGFDDLIKGAWAKPVQGRTPIQRWNNKVRNLRTFLRGWARHVTGMLKKGKDSFIHHY